VRILLTGRKGQVGWELERVLPALGEVIATDRSTLDFADADQIRRVVREAKPDVIVNAAAYTAVDKAESEPELAMRINGAAAGILAEEAKRLGALLMHYSTDYVFDGLKDGPYAEDDLPHPLNVYGNSKLEGERRIAASGCRYIMLRTSWVYGPRGSNFLLSILKKAREGAGLKVVNDQIGAPTSSAAIARATADCIKAKGEGLFHLSAQGTTSWQGFAEEIVRRAGLSVPVLPISSAQYPAQAKRPRNSLLDNSKLKKALGVTLPDWRTQLEEVMPQVLR
jgi:dTDP-4-dehydrorhamnose reductase